MNNSTQPGGAKRVLMNSSFYVFSALLVDAVGFFLLPVYLMFLDSSEYGKVSIANSFIDVAVIVAALSLHMAIARFYADYKTDKKKAARYFGTVLVFTLIVSVLFSVFCFLFGSLLEKYIFSGIDFYPMIFLVVISIPFRAIRNIHRFILRAMQSGGELALANLTVFVAQAVLTLILIGPLKMGASGMLLAALIIHLFYAIYIYVDLKIKKILTLCFDCSIIKQSLKYSLPIMPHNLSSYIATLVSRVLLNGFFGTATVGLYSVASQFGIVVNTIQSSSNNALTPWFFDYKNSGSKNKKTIQALTKAFTLFYAFCLLGVGLFAKEIIIILTGKDYLDAWKVIPVIVIAYCIKSIYYFYLNIFLYYKKASQKLFIGTVVGNLINVIVSAILTPPLQMYGPAIAMIVSQAFISVYVYCVGKKYDKDSFSIRLIAGPLLIALTVMIVGNILGYCFFNDTLNLLDLMMKIGLFIVFLLYCLATSKNEVKVLLYHIKSRKKEKIS